MPVERRAGRQIERESETVTVHSIDRESWLTKLDRIGELSTGNRTLVFNNIGHLITADMLVEQFRKLDGKKAVGIDKVTKILMKICEFSSGKYAVAHTSPNLQG